MKKLKIVLSFLLIILAVIAIVCIKQNKNDNKKTEFTENISVSSNNLVKTNKNNTTKNTISQESENKVSQEKQNTIPQKDKSTEETKKSVVEEENTKKDGTKTVVIDPGHQTKGDPSQEPIGPGATETKAKVTTGATGVTTKQTEATLNLKVSLKLRTELKKRGYNVIMTRTDGNVNLSNSERANIANNAKADVFVRIHADSVDESNVEGMSTLCQTANNKYNGYLAEKSYLLSKKVLDNMCKKTGAKNRGVTKTDNMSGINWAKVPVTIIEMGFLSNPNEDQLLATEDYQEKITQGIADGIDEFLEK